jgi:Fe-S cluster assembly iron-binding protein IscA
MALDEPTDNDEIHEEEAFSIIVDKVLLTEFGGVNIDFRTDKYRGTGFFIEPADKSCGSCSC